MKKIFLFVTLIIAIKLTNSQNLVPNGDFDSYVAKPNAYGQCDYATGWNNVNLGTIGGMGSPDYFYDPDYMPAYFGPISVLSGGQMGFVAWHGLIPHYREYFSTQLIAPMIHGKEYIVSFMLSNGSGGYYTYACNNIGIRFSKAPLKQVSAEIIQVNPQVEITTVNYINNYFKYFEFSFIADSAYQYITIGNFRQDAQTTLSPTGTNGAYYFMDDIAVIPFDQQLIVTGDSTICKGNSATLRAYGSTSYRWAVSTDPSTIISTTSTLNVTPTQTTTYLMFGTTNTFSFTVTVLDGLDVNLGADKTFCQGDSVTLDAGVATSYLWSNGAKTRTINVGTEGDYSVRAQVSGCSDSDTIHVGYKASCPTEIYFPTSFTPNLDGLNDLFRATTFSFVQKYELIIFNRFGQELFRSNKIQNGWNGKFKGLDQPAGTYTWIARYKFFGKNEEANKGTVLLLR